MRFSGKWRCLLVILWFYIADHTSLARNDNFLNLAEDTSCGEVQDLRRESKILGGKMAESGEFPFLASIQKPDGTHFCSAFIVGKQVLITAAHCFIDAMFGSRTYQNYKILVGSNSWTDTRNETNLFKISRVKIHPKYSYLKPNVENDIALLWTDRPFQWSTIIKPICIANSNLVHTHGLIAGWGVRSQTESLKEWMQDTNLYKVSLPIWTNEACQTEYMKHRINWNTKPSHLCAGYQEKGMDTCHGDSGAPLILFEEESGKRIAYGIVSVGEGCSTKLPGIYTRLSAFSGWIRDNFK